MGHMERVYKNKDQQQQGAQAQIAENNQQQEYMFVASHYASTSRHKVNWLVVAHIIWFLMKGCSGCSTDLVLQKS